MGEITPKNEGNVGSHGMQYLQCIPLQKGSSPHEWETHHAMFSIQS